MGIVPGTSRTEVRLTNHLASRTGKVCSHEDASKVAQDLSTSATSLATWLEHRGLILNERKFQVLTFAPRSNSEAQVTVLYRGMPLPSVSSAKDLGVTMDSNLSWHPHIQFKSLEVSRSIGALRRARNSLSLAAHINLYPPEGRSGGHIFTKNCVEAMIRLDRT